MNGKVTKLISNKWTVLVNDKKIVCSCIGKLRYEKKYPLVGDNVIIDLKTNVIKDIIPRKNTLIRPPVCNVDYAVIVASCVKPNFSTNLLDKMINIIEYNNIKPIICISKYDLLEDTSLIDDAINYYKKIGYDVFINSDISKIKEKLNGKISVLTGQTGAGKSSLLNKMDETLNLPTNEVSQALGRGKHTTRHVELIDIEGALIADTPGFSSLDFIGMTKDDIKNNFIEFYKNQDMCKYKDCMHIKENDCYIKKLVLEGSIKKFRYDNYVKFINDKEKERK